VRDSWMRTCGIWSSIMRSVVNNVVGKGLKLVATVPKGSPVLSYMGFADDKGSFPEYETLQTRLEGNVAHVTLNRPKRGNAFNMTQWEELKHAMATVDVIGPARCVVLNGSNCNFSTGMDLTVFAEMMGMGKIESCDGRKREGMMKIIDFFQAAISSPEDCRVPVIAAVEGHCIGAGVDLITACDLRYATKDATFCIKETDLAMVADVGTLQRLPRIVGDQRCRELAYTGRTFGGEEAQRMGLVLDVFDSADEMYAHVAEVTQQIASKSPLTVRGIKRTAVFARDHPVEEGLQQVKMLNSSILVSDDLQQALGGLTTKQAPEFKN